MCINPIYKKLGAPINGLSVISNVTRLSFSNILTRTFLPYVKQFDNVTSVFGLFTLQPHSPPIHQRASVFVHRDL